MCCIKSQSPKTTRHGCSLLKIPISKGYHWVFDAYKRCCAAFGTVSVSVFLQAICALLVSGSDKVRSHADGGGGLGLDFERETCRWAHVLRNKLIAQQTTACHF